MASTYSSLKIQLMGTGENSGTWGTITNTNLGTAIEEAIVGSANVNFSSADVTLTLTDTNSSQSARNLRLNLTGSVSAPQNLIVPAIEKVYIINNGLTQTITVKNSSGTGISVPAGKTEYVYNDGTNVVEAINHLTSLTIDTPLPITSGGTGTNSTTYANLQSNVSGTLPIANGGTGSTSTTYCNLQSNVSGTLPNANTTASSSNGASTIVARDASGNFTANTATLTTVTGDGSALTSLNASNVSSGTLAVARGGTGTSSPSLVGGTNITISGSWPNQTVTAAGGGVTSLNGQTGAITNTDFGAIGSVVRAANTTSSSYLPGATIAGSSLYYPNTITQTPSVSTLYSQGNNSVTTYTYWTTSNTDRQNSGNTGFQVPAGAAALSGTWRAMYFSNPRMSQFFGCDNTTISSSSVSVWVRIS